MGEDFRIAEWRVEPRLNIVTRDGTTTRIEPKVMAVLVCLAQHAGKPVTKDELLRTVWPDTFVTEDVLKRSVFELRRAFADDARESREDDERHHPRLQQRPEIADGGDGLRRRECVRHRHELSGPIP